MTTGGTFLGDLRIVLRGRDFRRLFATRLVSQAADGAFQAGLASLFFFSPERATTAGGVAAALAVAVLPYTIVGPFAGVLLDRWRRRQVLVVANLVRAGLVLGVAALVAADVVGLPLYVAVLVCLSVNRFILAGLGASLPHVVPADELVMANAVSPTSGTIAALLYAYLCRFFAVGFNPLQAGMAKIAPTMGDAARVLGCGPLATVARVHLPLLRPALLSAVLLVLVDVMKELPATLILRPFNFDTLAVEAFQLATTERLDGAAWPSLIIVAVGLGPVILLCRMLDRGRATAPL